MKTLKESKIDSVRNWLRNHVVPQKQFDGMTSYAMAVSLVDLMEEAEIRQMEEDLIKDTETHTGENYAS